MDELDEKALMLSNESDAFNKSAKRLRRHFCLEQWKMIGCITFIVIILILVIWLTVAPPGSSSDDWFLYNYLIIK